MDRTDLLPARDHPSSLNRAVSLVLERVDQLSASWMATRGEVADALSQIARDVERIRARGTEACGTVEVASPLLHHRLTEILRSEVLQGWRSGSDPSSVQEPEAVLALVSALEEYRARLWPGGHQDLAARLAEPDAFELMVEVAHDLRSPLNSILFLSEVLRSGQSGAISPHQRSQLGLIYGATMGMISVVSDVMELARDARGVGDDDPSPFSIGRVFDSVEEMVRPIAEEKGISLSFSPPDYDRCTGQPGPLGRVLLNLTTNALKFTEKGTVVVNARRVDRSNIEFSVRDTGRGISPEQQRNLFQPFQLAKHRTGYFFAEAGLGLSIARRLVGGLGSELRFESKIGEGTVFFFSVELPPV